MRIISDFHDYYDCVQAMGQDQGVVYLRNRSEVGTFPFPVYKGIEYRHGDYPLEIFQYVVGFCGKVYPLLKVKLRASMTSAICHNIDEVDNFIQQQFRRKDIEVYKSRQRFLYRYRDWHYWPPHQRRERMNEFFKEFATESDKHENVFVENKCPVFVARCPGRKLILNGCLKDVEFYRIRETQTAFQEIYMYLSGVLGQPNKPIPPVDDKDMRDAKGFDEWSFKKPPSKKRSRGSS